ncbi:MAG: beta(1,3)galactosyltransferase EpsH [Bacteroidetes bacterium]|nr:beta(1,3)galactosyltransferase EpsH [Bacteroidota bacterium]
MIFITYGTERFRFQRLTNKLKNIVNDKSFGNELFIIQMGASYECITSNISKVKIMDYCSFSEYSDYIDQADITVTHGGVGSILSVLYKNKVPIVVPRLKKYGEQIDDHQLQISGEFFSRKYIICLSDIDELSNYIINYKSETSGLAKYKPAFNDISYYLNNKYLN